MSSEADETLEHFISRAEGPVLVSACLLGLKTRYDGSDSKNAELVELAATARLVPVCPEQLGGLPTPRVRSTLTGGDGEDVLSGDARVVNEAERDVTENFLRGARQTLDTAKMFGAKFAVLKEKSPSCGVLRTYVDWELLEGCGVATAALKMRGTEIFVLP